MTHKPFQLHKSADKQFYFTIVSPNHQVQMTSETYTRKGAARSGIFAVCKTLDPQLALIWEQLIDDKTVKPKK